MSETDLNAFERIDWQIWLLLKLFFKIEGTQNLCNDFHTLKIFESEKQNKIRPTFLKMFLMSLIVIKKENLNLNC